jgi:predicted amidohydrolase
MSPPSTIRVGAAQLPAIPLDRHAEALPQIESAVTDAAARKLDLLVLPECAYPAYLLGSAAAYRAAGALSGADFVKRLAALAREHSIHVICGFVDDAGDHLHNAAVIVDATGAVCGYHHKSFMWGADNDYFAPGDALRPIDTPLGPIGVAICADARAPEVMAGLAAGGARLIALPTCWVNVATEPGAYHNAQAEFMIRARALECGVPIVAANKFGAEHETVSYCGMSQIVAPDGEIVAQADPDAAALIEAEVAPAAPPTMEVPDWAARRIFKSFAPVEPDAASLARVRIAVVPHALWNSQPSESAAPGVFDRLADDGVQVVATSVQETASADQLEVHGRALGMVVVAYPHVERLMMERFGAFGCVASEHVRMFAPIRAMALDGAAIVFVTGEEVPVALLRTRAVENRIFIAAADHDSALLIDPAGAVIAHAPAPAGEPIVTEIDLAAATHKEVYPRTHIWQQRRPELYAAAFGVK